MILHQWREKLLLDAGDGTSFSADSRHEQCHWPDRSLIEQGGKGN
jgi:hypothetical protein